MKMCVYVSLQGQLPLSGMNVCLCDGEEEDAENSFEMSGNFLAHWHPSFL